MITDATARYAAAAEDAGAVEGLAAMTSEALAGLFAEVNDGLEAAEGLNAERLASLATVGRGQRLLCLGGKKSGRSDDRPQTMPDAIAEVASKHSGFEATTGLSRSADAALGDIPGDISDPKTLDAIADYVEGGRGVTVMYTLAAHGEVARSQANMGWVDGFVNKIKDRGLGGTFNTVLTGTDATNVEKKEGSVYAIGGSNSHYAASKLYARCRLLALYAGAEDASKLDAFATRFRQAVEAHVDTADRKDARNLAALEEVRAAAGALEVFLAERSGAGFHEHFAEVQIGVSYVRMHQARQAGKPLSKVSSWMERNCGVVVSPRNAAVQHLLAADALQAPAGSRHEPSVGRSVPSRRA